ncbi:MAG TPA: polysaccharide deacetylase family protein [Bellilinea sp.]|nr:polysaccharide deacetylase family protein [Bellilinea sp.]
MNPLPAQAEIATPLTQANSTALILTPTSTPIRTVTSTPTSTPPPIPTATPTLVPPPMFESDALNDGVNSVSYLQDRCLYLEARWNPANAAPGTVVLPVMFHGISPNGPRGRDNITISTTYFQASMDKARKLGFEAISMQQLVDFLQHNAYIPPRSLLLIIDDRRLGTVREHFLPVLEKYDWTLTMAYITGVINEQEWNQVRDVLDRGHTELQAHGYLHNGETYITEWTSDEIMRDELFAPILSFEEHLGYRPIAYIWPGGNFNQTSVTMAREAEYQVAFTAFARGPLLFNWVPQGEPERELSDPLMTLPRYWSTTLFRNLDYALEIGGAAAAQAESQRMDEINWYRSNCPAYPPLSFPLQNDLEEVPDRW